ncbi:SAM-dependent MTase TRM10-type domain-containing protein [Mycena kentingensis (nom. inval.)]|nr:SAM-dependent MTase TRM10-type domain-containing protein [Mycena kentingensis (nom. inval.)]
MSNEEPDVALDQPNAEPDVAADEDALETATGDQPSVPMTKSAMKKAARRERIAQQRGERRLREREARKAKKRERHEKRAAGELDEEDMPQPKKRKLISFGGRVVVDLGFDKDMTDKEITSLVSQLGYTHSANRAAGTPFSLLFTSLNGQTLTKLTNQNESAYLRWKGTEWWPENYDRLWATDEAVKPTVVYLTADSEEELSELKPDETYIIGGIVDHNRLRHATLNKANEGGVRTARLPIGRYLSELRTRKVLTVNQTFEILVHWVESRDWEAAFNSVVPKRKFDEGGRKNKRKKGADDDGDDDVEEEEKKIVLTTEISQKYYCISNAGQKSGPRPHTNRLANSIPNFFIDDAKPTSSGSGEQ